MTGETKLVEDFVPLSEQVFLITVKLFSPSPFRSDCPHRDFFEREVSGGTRERRLELGFGVFEIQETCGTDGLAPLAPLPEPPLGAILGVTQKCSHPLRLAQLLHEKTADQCTHTKSDQHQGLCRTQHTLNIFLELDGLRTDAFAPIPWF